MKHVHLKHLLNTMAKFEQEWVHKLIMKRTHERKNPHLKKPKCY